MVQVIHYPSGFRESICTSEDEMHKARKTLGLQIAYARKYAQMLRQTRARARTHTHTMSS